MGIPDKVKRELVNRVAKIEFVKVLRDSPSNKARIEEHEADLVGGNKGPVRGLTYDWDIIVDGVKKGQFRRITYGKGYDVVNLVGEWLRWPNGSMRRVDRQDQFHAEVVLLERGEIGAGWWMSPKQAAAYTRKKATEAERARKKAHAHACQRFIKDHAMQMYALVTDLAVATEVDQAQSCIERAHRLVEVIKKKLPPLEGFTNEA